MAHDIRQKCHHSIDENKKYSIYSNKIPVGTAIHKFKQLFLRQILGKFGILMSVLVAFGHIFPTKNVGTYVRQGVLE